MVGGEGGNMNHWWVVFNVNLWLIWVQMFMILRIVGDDGHFIQIQSRHWCGARSIWLRWRGEGWRIGSHFLGKGQQWMSNEWSGIRDETYISVDMCLMIIVQGQDKVLRARHHTCPRFLVSTRRRLSVAVRGMSNGKIVAFKLRKNNNQDRVIPIMLQVSPLGPYEYLHRASWE